jgi:hypothetical protein
MKFMLPFRSNLLIPKLTPYYGVRILGKIIQFAVKSGTSHDKRHVMCLPSINDGIHDNLTIG